MLPQWIIEKKRDGQELSEDDIRYFIGGFTSGTIPDYQMSALAMAILLRGMTSAETAILTNVMMMSGDLVDTTSIKLPRIDKHSTGGIGDKISLVLAPLAACCGLAVPMISGRGLGITGGTLDKLESIPGYRTDLSEKEFVSIISKCGCSIIGQTERLAPADRKLYALRDVTGTVPSIPLIVASIMSKKLAAGLDGLVLDVKCGRGAFMKTGADAKALATALLEVARHMGKAATALITDMDQPLGRTAGNTLEVIEAIEVLKGGGPRDIIDLTLALCARMLVLAKVTTTESYATTMLRAKLSSGEAFARFVQMVALHKGDTSVLSNPSRFGAAAIRVPI
ncbi:MAG: thymidine phosphorylase, partial [bacterium]